MYYEETNNATAPTALEPRRADLGPLDELRPGDAWQVALAERKKERREKRAYRLQQREIQLMNYRQYWLANVSCDRSLSGTAKHTAMILWGNFVDKQLFYTTGKLEAYPSIRTIATKIGRGKSTADRALKQLEEAGWLGVKRGGFDRDKNHARPNRYRILNYRNPKPDVSDLDVRAVEMSLQN